jgi:hypothetical protein
MNPSGTGQNGGTGPRYNRGIIGLMGGQPNNSLVGSLYGAWQQHKTDQQMNAGMDRDIATSDPASVIGGSSTSATPDAGLSPETALQPSQQAMGDAVDLATDAFAHGKVVTSPTVALLAENGPEKVVPMSPGPTDKTMGLTDEPIKIPSTLGGSARARYRHPLGPVALAHTKPISGDLPLKPNSAIR